MSSDQDSIVKAISYFNTLTGSPDDWGLIPGSDSTTGTGNCNASATGRTGERKETTEDTEETEASSSICRSKHIINLPEHVDLGTVTLLPIACEPGLEVLDRYSNRWISVENQARTPLQTVCVISGLQLQYLTSDFFPATVHRVVNRVQHGRRRLSLPFLQRAPGFVELDPRRIPPQTEAGSFVASYSIIQKTLTCTPLSLQICPAVTVDQCNAQYLQRCNLALALSNDKLAFTRTTQPHTPFIQ